MAGKARRRVTPVRAVLTAIAGPEETILDGTGLGTRIITIVGGQSQDTVIDGFTITNGIADFGVGMYVLHSSPTIRNCIFEHNTATGSGTGGGGMYIFGGSPSIIDCDFIENVAELGGGLNIIGSEPWIESCRLIGNIALLRGGGIGGGSVLALMLLPSA